MIFHSKLLLYQRVHPDSQAIGPIGFHAGFLNGFPVPWLALRFCGWVESKLRILHKSLEALSRASACWMVEGWIPSRKVGKVEF